MAAVELLLLDAKYSNLGKNSVYTTNHNRTHNKFGVRRRQKERVELHLGHVFNDTARVAASAADGIEQL